jgi:phage FluMu protein Com
VSTADARSAERTIELPELRCPRCKALLLKGTLVGEIKCPKCNYMLRMDPTRRSE